MPSQKIKLRCVVEVNLGQAIGQLRAVPVRLGAGQPGAVLVIYGADFDNDPSRDMFFFPSDTLKMALISARGEILWQRDLGRGVVPGLWFCPVFAFDLDGDGFDEIWYVNNLNTNHPLSLRGYHLERVDARNGQTTGQWPWPDHGEQIELSFTYRNFILGGLADGVPVLVTAQGTYTHMYLQGWNTDMSLRWEHTILREAQGARGSHMCAISDLDEDGVQEVLWGERCIELNEGHELFCADREVYRGHSDIAVPVLDRTAGHWLFYTCRESDPKATPRVVMFDRHGQRVWGQVEQGHMDMGWTAWLGDTPTSMSIRIGSKSCGPDGRFHFERDEFTFNAFTGEHIPLPFSVYGTLPVDVNGDGCHELVRGIPGADGAILDRSGIEVGSVGGPVALLSKFLELPGEQILSYHADGMLRMWADENAEDSPAALARYANPIYRANQQLTAVGYNLVNLGGF